MGEDLYAAQQEPSLNTPEKARVDFSHKYETSRRRIAARKLKFSNHNDCARKQIFFNDNRRTPLKYENGLDAGTVGHRHTVSVCWRPIIG